MHAHGSLRALPRPASGGEGEKGAPRRDLAGAGLVAIGHGAAPRRLLDQGIKVLYRSVGWCGVSGGGRSFHGGRRRLSRGPRAKGQGLEAPRRVSRRTALGMRQLIAPRFRGVIAEMIRPHHMSAVGLRLSVARSLGCLHTCILAGLPGLAGAAGDGWRGR